MSRTFLTACVIVLLCGSTPARASAPPPPEVVQAAAKRFAVELEQRTEMARIDGERGLLDLDRLRRDVEEYRSDLEWLHGQAAQLDDCDRDELRPTLDAVHALVWNLGRAAEGRRLPERPRASSDVRVVPTPGARTGIAAASPSNDSCGQAAAVDLGTYFVTTGAATNDGNATCGSSFFSPDVWFSFTPETYGPYYFETFDASFDTVLSLHEGCPGTTDNELRCDDDTLGTGSYIGPVYLSAGETTLIRLSGFDGATGLAGLVISRTAATLSGTATESDGGAAAEGGQVRIFNAEGMQVAYSFVQSDGAWTKSGLPAGAYFVAGPFGSRWVPEVWQDHPCDGSACDPTSGDAIEVLAGATVDSIDLVVQRSGVIRGTVRDQATGLAVGSATVRIYDPTGSQITYKYTATDGSYEAVGVSNGTRFVKAQHSSYLAELFDNLPCDDDGTGTCDPTRGTPVLVEPDGEQVVDFDLSPRASISGTVISAFDGAPIYGARVRVYRASSSVLIREDYTDAAGFWKVGGLEPGTYVAVAEDYGFQGQLYLGIDCPVSCEPSSGGTPIAVIENQQVSGVDFELAALGRIVGEITDAATGEPAEGIVRVEFFRDGVTSAGAVNTTSGEYRGPPLLSGSYRVLTVSTGYRDELHDGVACEPSCDLANGTDVDVTTNTETTVDFDLVAAGRIFGTVSLEMTGEPLLVTVEVWAADGTLAGTSRSDLGAWSVAGLDPGVYFVSTNTLAATSVGPLHELHDDIPCWRGAPESCTPATGTPVTVMDLTPTRVDFTLRRGGVISGTVSDAVSGEGLHATLTVASTTSSFVTTKTTTSGLYTVNGLAPDSYRVMAREHYDPVHAVTVFPDAPCDGLDVSTCGPDLGAPVAVGLGEELVGVDIPMLPFRKVRGRVDLDLDGSPWSDGEVVAWLPGLNRYRSAQTNAFGSYELESIAPGVAFVFVSNIPDSGLMSQIYDAIDCADPVSSYGEPGCRPTDGTPLQVGLYDDVDGVDFHLKVRGSVSGTVRSLETGAPAYPLSVTLWPQASDDPLPFQTTWTDPSGRYRFDSLPPGTYFVATKRTTSSTWLLDMLFNGFPCYAGPPGGCDPTKGTPILVSQGQIVTGIDLGLPGTTAGIAGVVVDAASDAALAGIAIDAWDAATGTYVAGALSTPAGSWFIELDPGTYFLSTANGQDYVDQLWNGIECPDGSAWAGGCDVTLGLPVVVSGTDPVGGLWFRLVGPLLFADDFENGSTGGWSATMP